VTLRERDLRLLLIAVVVVIGLGVWAFVIRGADGPSDPVLGGSASSQRIEELAPPGDPERVPIAGGFSEQAIAVEPNGGGELLAWCLLAALDEAHRGQGLMNVTDLQGYSGMLFAFPQDVQNSFYMKDTLIPLSIAWLDSGGDVVTIMDMEPCGSQDPCPLYTPSGPYRTAIEVPKGDLNRLGISEGARVTLLPACAARTAA
jgi:uncharacterized membrane protein (UPF0127 family)